MKTFVIINAFALCVVIMHYVVGFHFHYIWNRCYNEKIKLWRDKCMTAGCFWNILLFFFTVSIIIYGVKTGYKTTDLEKHIVVIIFACELFAFVIAWILLIFADIIKEIIKAVGRGLKLLFCKTENF